MNILICDDKKAEADLLAALLSAEQSARKSESGFDIRIALFSNSLEALDHVRSGALVDLCFLDIIMPEMNGITLAENLRSCGYRGEIVFLTTSNDFARQSYQVRAFDYLIKPPTPEGVRSILQILENKLETTDKKGLSVKTQRALRYILFRNISHIEVIDHIVHIRLLRGTEIKVNATFSEIARQLLSDSRFVQCHRSYIVNMSDIEIVTDRQVIMQNGAKIPISRGFSIVKDKMMKWIFTGEYDAT